LKLEVQWLAYLATEEGMLDSAKCLVLKHALGPDTDILAFGEKLYDRGYCSYFEKLQELVNHAYKKAEVNEPVPSNPFDILRSASSRVSIPTRRTSFSSSSIGLHNGSIETVRTQPQESVLPATQLRDVNPPPAEPATTRPRISMRRSSFAPETEAFAQPESPKVQMVQRVQAAPAQAPIPTAQVAADPVPVVIASPSPAHQPKLSREMPHVSLDVDDEWPDFTEIHSLSEKEARQFLVQLLLKSQSEAASDLHLCADARPFFRRNRKVEYLSDYLLTDEDAEKLNKALLSEQQLFDFEKNHDLDFALAFDLSRRYRVNLMLHKDGTSGTYRLVPEEVKTLEELGFENPETIKKLLTYHNGLIMVTGPLGAGKTATLAALVDELNRQRQDHLITVESPIEIVQHSNQCHITQREVGSHTQTFHSALKGALRQDPDIIVIGEMRDLETVEMAISASETGHLVIGTMHTSDAANTLNRLLDVFPAAQQTQIRSMVAESLRGIICQRLLPSTQGGVELAYELLLNSPAVGNLIRTNKADGLSNIIETGRRDGMVLMDKSIFALWEANRISDEVALKNLISQPMKQHIRQSGKTAVSA
jgi:twitching motility protein PilT